MLRTIPDSLRPSIATTLLLFAAASYAQSNEGSISNEEVDKRVKDVIGETSSFTLQLRAPSAERLIPGRASTIDLVLDVDGLPEGYDMYAIVVMADGERIVVERHSRDQASPASRMRSLKLRFDNFDYEAFATFSRSNVPVLRTGYALIRGAEFTVGGILGNGMHSVLHVGEGSYPVHMALPMETLAQAFTQDADKILQMREEDEKFPFAINLVYLATKAGGKGESLSGIRTTITPPEGVIYFDGIVLLPTVVKRYRDGFSVLRFADARTNRLILPSETPPDAKRPTYSQSNPQESDRPGESINLSVAATPRKDVRIGRQVTLDVRATYANLPPASELYLLIQPANGNQVVRNISGGTRRITSNQVAMRLCADPDPRSGQLKITDRPIVLSTPIFGDIEGGWLASVEKGGDGSANGTVTFTPPPYNEFYDRIRITPVALTWDASGRLCTFLNTETAPRLELAVTGR